MAVVAVLAFLLRPELQTDAPAPASGVAAPVPEGLPQGLPGSMPAREPATAAPQTPTPPAPKSDSSRTAGKAARPVAVPNDVPAAPASEASQLGAAPLVVIPPASVPIGAKLFFQARAPRAEKVLLFYRANVGGAAFQNRPMQRNGDVWTANVAVESRMLPGVQYFVKASAGSEHWSEGSPLRPLLANVGQ